jgi:peptidoglycan hydrolase CwlO-like protein
MMAEDRYFYDPAADRYTVERYLADLKARSASLEGTYTTEALLKEMLRQGVSDLQSVQKNLKDDTDRTQARLFEVQAELARLRREAGR